MAEDGIFSREEGEGGGAGMIRSRVLRRLVQMEKVGEKEGPGGGPASQPKIQWNDSRFRGFFWQRR